jgi:hypothetical protein
MAVTLSLFMTPPRRLLLRSLTEKARVRRAVRWTLFAQLRSITCQEDVSPVGASFCVGSVGGKPCSHDP